LFVYRKASVIKNVFIADLEIIMLCEIRDFY